MLASTDTVIRAMTHDGSFRVIVAFTTDTNREIVRLQAAKGHVVQQLADLVTGTILVRETMAPQLRVQGVLRPPGGKGTLVADSHPDGTSRGLANLPESAGTLLDDGSVLLMMRTLPSGKLHQGMVEVRQARGLSDALMTYFQESEQVSTTLSVGTIVQGEELIASGGYLVQLLPELSESVLAVMTERLSAFPPIDTLLSAEGTSPDRVLEELLYGMPYTVTETSTLSFACNCSIVRIVAGLATLGREEIASLVEKREVLDISCDFCGQEYHVPPDQLAGLLTQN